MEKVRLVENEGKRAEDKEKERGKKEDASSPYTVIAGRFEFKARLSWSPL